MAYDSVLENAFDRGDELDADKFAVDTDAEARLRADVAGRLSDAARRAQQGPGRAQRPVRVAPRHQGAHQEDPRSGARRSRRRRRSRRATRRTSSTSRRPSRRSRWWPTVAPGLTGSSTAAKETAKKKEEPKKGVPVCKPEDHDRARRSSRRRCRHPEAPAELGADRAAKGGSNPNPVKVSVSAAEIEAFRKGIA